MKWFSCLAALLVVAHGAHVSALGGVVSGLKPKAITSTPVVHRLALPEFQPRVLDDASGAISRILLLYSVSDAPSVSPPYQDLLNQLPVEIGIVVCAADSVSIDDFRKRFREPLSRKPRAIQFLEVGFLTSAWSRDRIIARMRADFKPASSLLPLGADWYREEEWKDLEVFQSMSDQGVMVGNFSLPLHLEGGNVVGGSDHVFVGFNAITDNLVSGMQAEDIRGWLGKALGKDVVFLQDEDGNVPKSHADMYLTPLPGNKTLLADPRLGTQLLEGVTEGSLSYPEVEGVDRGVLFFMHDDRLSDQFDQISQAIQQQGLEVDRLPGVFAGDNEWMVTYNNVLMDFRRGHAIVYMPVYHLDALDNAARKVYESKGFEVRTINVSTVFHLNGAIRCLANVIERKPTGFATPQHRSRK
ncbi:MAG: hypothetical protein ACFHW5_21840 [Verrucomicrobiota bacterium]|jgi:hypothetical protein